MTAREPFVLRTARTTLRPWRDDDREPWATMCADARVMEFFPSVLSRAQSDEFVDRMMAVFDSNGWGLWALDVSGAGFAGFVGLMPVGFDATFTPATEIGWRLAAPYWGQGLATEAALAAADFGFQTLSLGEIVSFTAEINLRSRRVMEKIGMHHSPAEDFEHPRVPPGDPLRPHVLYRMGRPD